MKSQPFIDGGTDVIVMTPIHLPSYPITGRERSQKRHRFSFTVSLRLRERTRKRNETKHIDEKLKFGTKGRRGRRRWLVRCCASVDEASAAQHQRPHPGHPLRQEELSQVGGRSLPRCTTVVHLRISLELGDRELCWSKSVADVLLKSSTAGE